MTAAAVVFVLSLIGLIGLFGLKNWEARHARAIFPSFRAQLDRWALRLDELLNALMKDAGKIPPEVLHLSRITLHEVALFVGGMFHFLAQQTHRLADFFSHKRNFVRREPRSEFLKKVSERSAEEEEA